MAQGAEVLGVSHTTLSRLINGQAGGPRRWPSASPKVSAQRPTFGYGCRQPMIWRKLGGMRTTLGWSGTSTNSRQPNSPHLQRSNERIGATRLVCSKEVLLTN